MSSSLAWYAILWEGSNTVRPFFPHPQVLISILLVLFDCTCSVYYWTNVHCPFYKYIYIFLCSFVSHLECPVIFLGPNNHCSTRNKYREVQVSTLYCWAFREVGLIKNSGASCNENTLDPWENVSHSHPDPHCDATAQSSRSGLSHRTEKETWCRQWLVFLTLTRTFCILLIFRIISTKKRL